MKLAYTMASGRGDTDPILQGLASEMAERGLRRAGIVQINSERGDAEPGEMDVRVRSKGPVPRISQNLGPSSRGCRLDPAALETAVGLVSARLSAGADVLLINKFGKQEAEGRGFRDVIADAVAMEIPVPVGLNALNQAAFDTFAGGLAVQRPPEPEPPGAWVGGATEDAARVA